MDNVIDGKKISEEIRSELKQSIKYEMLKPSVAVIQVGENEASESYVKMKEKACDEVGIYFRHYKFDLDASELSIINKIKELNNDEYVNGIIVQLPLPEGYNEKRLINTIINSKDVDGLTDINTGRLVNGRKTLTPCTAAGVIELLKRSDVEIKGKNVVLVGRGKLTCKPLIQLFLNEDATVTVCHSKTKDLSTFTKNADILVSAVGINNIIKAEMVKDGAVVIDVGINYDTGKISGDVDFDKVSKKASLITKTPGGVGPMTVTMLLKNTVYCFLNRKK